jgi:hypothetical protein
MLVSYWYWRKRDLGTIIDQLALPAVHLKLFADSGAFSAYTLRAGGGTIKREDYAAWLKTWQSRLSVMINLDVIGDAKESARNQLWLEQQGLPVLPVYHLQSPMAELVALCRDYDYIAIGGTATLTGQAKLMASARVMRVAHDHGTRVHGLGRSAVDELNALPFYSVDSTAWMRQRSGSFQLYQAGRMISLRFPVAVAHPVLLRAHGIDPQRLAASTAYGNTGRNYGIVKDYSHYRREADEWIFSSAVAWKRFEAWLRNRHKVPSPPGQETNGTNVWFADDNMLHQQQMINAVAWLAKA